MEWVMGVGGEERGLFTLPFKKLDILTSFRWFRSETNTLCSHSSQSYYHLTKSWMTRSPKQKARKYWRNPADINSGRCIKSAKNPYFKAEIRHTWYYWYCICWSLLKNHAFEKVLIFTTTILIGEYVRLAKKIYSLINVSANALWTVSKYYLRSLAIAWSYWSLNL